MKNVFCCHHLTINIISFIAKNCNLHLAKEAYLIINKHVIMDYAKIGYTTTLGITKVIHPKYYKHLKTGTHQSHLGKQKMGWFLAD